MVIYWDNNKMYSTNHSFVNIYLLNATLLLGFLVHKSAEPSSSFQSVLKPRMCVRWVRKTNVLLWLQLPSALWRHGAANQNVAKIYIIRKTKMWQKYTKFSRLKCGENIQNSHFWLAIFANLLDDSQAKLQLYSYDDYWHN